MIAYKKPKGGFSAFWSDPKKFVATQVLPMFDAYQRHYPDEILDMFSKFQWVDAQHALNYNSMNANERLESALDSLYWRKWDPEVSTMGRVLMGYAHSRSVGPSL